MTLASTVSSEVSSSEDPRFTLTAEERFHVLRLRERCDEEGVSFRSVFELAKYSLVCSSIQDDTKRLEESFKRIRKKRLFEEKYKLHALDLEESLEVLERGMPNWYVP